MDCLVWRDQQDRREPMEPLDPKVTEVLVEHLDLLGLLESSLCFLQTFSSRETLHSRTGTREKLEEMPSAKDLGLRRTATWI